MLLIATPALSCPHACVHTVDDAYVQDPDQREAYLEQDVGTIWRGVATHKTPLQWEYGQVSNDLPANEESV